MFNSCTSSYLSPLSQAIMSLNSVPGTLQINKMWSQKFSETTKSIFINVILAVHSACLVRVVFDEQKLHGGFQIMPLSYIIKRFRHCVSNWFPFNVLKQGYDRNRYIGKHKKRKSDCISDFFPARTMNFSPLRQGCNETK